MPEKEYVIIETTVGSWFAGYLESREGTNAVLTQAQRLRVELGSPQGRSLELGTTRVPIDRLAFKTVMDSFPVTPEGQALIEAGHVQFFVQPGQPDAFDKIRRD